MATQTTTLLIDDIDGSTDDVITCAFGLGDSHFEIDLGTAHRGELEDVLAKFVEAAREVSAPRTVQGVEKGKKKRAARPAEDLSAVRNWARDNGLTVSSRGRIPRDVLESYRAAQ